MGGEPPALAGRLPDMDVAVPVLNLDGLLGRVAGLVPGMADRAGALDAGAAFPTEDMDDLREAGVLGAVCPRRFGGLGLGTEAAAALDTLHLMRLLGRGNLAVGRLIEAHVNALKLVCVHGNEAARRACCADAAAGHLFGLWVTGDGLFLQGGALRGGKDICSGAGFATRALVTVNEGADAPVMRVVDVSAARVSGSYLALHGMRAACNAAMDLDGVPAGIAIGQPGDYLRQPVFSAGAWRTSAVTLGGLEALVSAAISALKQRGRAGDPHQQIRIGHMTMAQHTAYLWMRQAAEIAEAEHGEPARIAAFVNLARMAVERAGLESIQLAQQCLGLGAMVQGNGPERMMRDLATYLRQPAPDLTLTEAAAYFTQYDMPAP
jgi:alkylation response protein AidB-like acyl-CoA dehydrogenase